MICIFIIPVLPNYLKSSLIQWNKLIKKTSEYFPCFTQYLYYSISKLVTCHLVQKRNERTNNTKEIFRYNQNKSENFRNVFAIERSNKWQNFHDNQNHRLRNLFFLWKQTLQYESWNLQTWFQGTTNPVFAIFFNQCFFANFDVCILRKDKSFLVDFKICISKFFKVFFFIILFWKKGKRIKLFIILNLNRQISCKIFKFLFKIIMFNCLYQFFHTYSFSWFSYS